MIRFLQFVSMSFYTYYRAHRNLFCRAAVIHFFMLEGLLAGVFASQLPTIQVVWLSLLLLCSQYMMCSFSLIVGFLVHFLLCLFNVDRTMESCQTLHLVILIYPISWIFLWLLRWHTILLESVNFHTNVYLVHNGWWCIKFIYNPFCNPGTCVLFLYFGTVLATPLAGKLIGYCSNKITTLYCMYSYLVSLSHFLFTIILAALLCTLSYVMPALLSVLNCHKLLSCLYLYVHVFAVHLEVNGPP